MSELNSQVAKLMAETGTKITDTRDLEALSKVSVRQLARLFDEIAKNLREPPNIQKSKAEIFQNWTKKIIEQFEDANKVSKEEEERRLQKPRSSSTVSQAWKERTVVDDAALSEEVSDCTFEDRWGKAGTRDERTVEIPLHAVTVLEGAEKFLSAFGLTPVGKQTTSGNMVSVKAYGKRQKVHPVLLKVKIEKKSDGTVVAIVTARSANELASRMINDELDAVVDALSEVVNEEVEKKYQVFDDQTEKKSSIPLPTGKVSSLIDAYEQLIAAARDSKNRPFTTNSNKKKARLNITGAESDDLSKLTAVVRGEVKEDENKTFVVNLSSKCVLGNEDEAQEIMGGIEDALVDRIIAELGPNNLKDEVVTIAGYPDIDEVVAKLIEGVGAQPIGRNKDGSSGKLTFVSKKNIRSPVFLKASIIEDDEITVRVTASGEDSKAVESAMKSVIDSLEKEGDPEEQWKDIWHSDDVQPLSLLVDLNGTNDIQDALELLNELVQPIGPVKYGKKAATLKFFGKKNQKHPVVIKAKVLKDDEGVIKVSFLGKAVEQSDVKDVLSSILEGIEQRDPIRSFDKENAEIPISTERTNRIELPKVNSLVDAFEKVARATESKPLASRDDKKKGKFCLVNKRNKASPVLLKAQIHIDDDGSCSIQATTRSTDDEARREFLEQLQDDLFNNDWARLGDAGEKSKSVEVVADSVEQVIDELCALLGEPLGKKERVGKREIVKLLGKKNKLHPIQLKAEIVEKEPGKYTATIKARTDPTEYSIRDQLVSDIVSQLDPVGKFDRGYEQLKGQERKDTLQVPNAESLQDLYEQLSKASDLTPVTRPGKPTHFVLTGKRNKAHPILLKGNVKANPDGTFSIELTTKSADPEATKAAIDDLQDALFENAWNKLGIDAGLLNLIDITGKSLEDAIQKVANAAEAVPIRIKKQGNKRIITMIGKNQKKHPVLLKAEISTTDDANKFLAEIQARSNDEDARAEVSMNVKDILERAEDPQVIFQDLWENANAGSSTKPIDLYSTDLDDATDKLLQDLGLTPVGQINRDGRKNEISFYGKKQKAHPVLLKAVIEKDKDGNVQVTFTGKSEDKNALKDEIDHLNQEMDKLDPNTVFDKTFKALEGKNAREGKIRLPGVNTLDEAMDQLVNMLNVQPVNKKGDKGKAKFIQKRTGKSPVLLTCSIDQEPDGTYAASIQGRSEDTAADILEIIDSLADKVFDNVLDTLGGKASGQKKTVEIKGQTVEDVIDYILKNAGENLIPIAAPKKGSNNLKLFGKNQKKHPLLLKVELTKDGDNVIATILSNGDDEEERIEASESVLDELEKLNNVSYKDSLGHVAQFVPLGLPFNSSEALTVASTDDVLTELVKHSFKDNNMVLEFNCKAGDPSTFKLEYAKVSLNGEEIKPVKQTCQKNAHDPNAFQTFIELGSVPKNLNNLTVTVSGKDTSDPLSPKDKKLTIPIGQVEINPSDYIRPARVNYAKHWDDLQKCEHIESFEFPPGEDVASACLKVIEATPIPATNTDDKVGEKHTVRCSGKLAPSSSKIDPHVLMNCNLTKNKNGNIQLEAICHAEDPDSRVKVPQTLVEALRNLYLEKERKAMDKDMSDLLQADQSSERNKLSEEAEKKRRSNSLKQEEKKKKLRATVVDYSFDIKDLDSQKWLKARFDVIKFDPKATFKSKVKRTWELDFFAGQFKNMDRKGKIKKCPEPAKLFQVEKQVGDVKRLVLNFFEATHKYELIFESNEQRERFYECANAMRPSLYVWCPNICKPGEARCRTQLHGTFNFQEKGVKVQNQGSCQINVTAKPYETISIWCGTWNMSGIMPPKDPRLMRKYIPAGKHDLFALAVQESGFAKDKEGFLKYVVSILDPSEYVVLTYFTLWDIQLCVATRKRHFQKITNLQGEQKATGLLNIAGNKGGVAIGLTFNETSMLFISSHLAANNSGETPNSETDNTKIRNQNIEEIIGALKLGNKSLDINGQYHHIFFMGDMNYRVELPFEEAFKLAQEAKYEKLLEKDQLKSQLANGILYGFKEADIKFQPTYKIVRDSLAYDNTKQRTPSYCDRILWKSLSSNAATCLEYKACTSILTSDHLPVSAVFKVNTVRPFASIFAKDDGVCQFLFESIKVIGRENTKENLLKNPIITFYAPFISTFAATNGKISKTCNPEWTTKMIPVISPSTCNKDYLKLQHFILALREGDAKDHTDNLVGTAAMSTKIGLDTSQLVSQKIDLLLRGRKTGEIEVTYKIVYRKREE